MNDDSVNTPAIIASLVSTNPAVVQLQQHYEAEIPFASAEIVEYVDSNDEEEPQIGTCIDVEMVGSHSNINNHISYVQHLTWEDHYFDNESDVIAVFDFDHKTLEAYYYRERWVNFCLVLFVCPHVFIILIILLYPCRLRKEAKRASQAKHVAITCHGVRLVVEHHTCWSCYCTGNKTSITMVRMICFWT
jgi:hypothetical protein